MSISKIFRRGFAASLALVTLVACDKSSTGPSSSATLVVKNESSQSIQMVQIAKCTDEYWGVNRLGSNESMAPGTTRNWTVEPGCWDLRLTTATRSDEWFDIELQSGGSIQLALTNAALASLDVSTLELSRKR